MNTMPPAAAVAADASVASQRGEYGAKTALRNAVAVTLFLAVSILGIVAIASFL